MEAEGSFIFINNKIGQSVPHLHIHILPRKMHDGFRGFFWPRRPYSSEYDMDEIRMKIKRAME
jgi:histidine triad (HIT) family protein